VQFIERYAKAVGNSFKEEEEELENSTTEL